MEAAPSSGWRAWMQRHRESPRAAFLLRTIVTVASAGLALLWTRALVRTLGKEIYGLFLAFTAVTQLGGLGDLGLSGAMGLRVIRLLALREDDECRRFLATSRGLFLALALISLAAGVLLSPWWPDWFHFEHLPAAGSLPLLFAYGGIGVAVLIACGYIQNLNYVHGNVVWPIIPNFLLAQAALGGQWLLATQQAPLWAQYLPHLGTMIIGTWIGWLMLKVSHPWLGELRPVRWEKGEVRSLAESSFWVYLGTLGTLLYMTTDRLVINGVFGPSLVPAYRFNYRLCELAIGFLSTASYVALPAIVRRLLSESMEEKPHGFTGLDRLRVLQAAAGAAAAQGYLLINDGFIRLWLGRDFQVPLSWQAGFAAVIAITISADAGVQILGRLSQSAIRIAGLTIALTAVLNFSLSLASAKMGSILGIVVATFIAQTIASSVMNWQTCRLLGLPYGRTFARTWLAPIAATAGATAIRWTIPLSSAGLIVLAILLNLALLAAIAWAVGLRREMIQFELQKFRSLFQKT
jgi:O-antigen/teichoic acid export membrane protein